MSERKRKSQKDQTARYLDTDSDEEHPPQQQRFSRRSAGAQQQKMERTALMRAAEAELEVNPESLPIGEVIQVYSLFCDVEHEGVMHLCVVRKTMAKLSATAMVVGDRVRFRTTGSFDDSGRPEAVIEQVLPRRTILTRSDSFKAMEQHPIVANAGQMLIVASLREPEVRWGLVDRMIIAAQSGGLRPIVCLNKIDLCPAGNAMNLPEEAAGAMSHYESLGITTLRTSVPGRIGLDELRAFLGGHTTVLAGHSGVGKSSLIRAIQPSLDLRIGAISGYTGKGRHTTTFARRYGLDSGGFVVDTPGVKLFGLWGISRENLVNYFPDVESKSAPPWRLESYQRILESLPAEEGAAGERRG